VSCRQGSNVVVARVTTGMRRKAHLLQLCILAMQVQGYLVRWAGILLHLIVQFSIRHNDRQAVTKTHSFTLCMLAMKAQISGLIGRYFARPFGSATGNRVQMLIQYKCSFTPLKDTIRSIRQLRYNGRQSRTKAHQTLHVCLRDKLLPLQEWKLSKRIANDTIVQWAPLLYP
jgi:hypothetical protein